MQITFSNFGGLTPRLSDHALGYAAATLAHDVNLRNGRLEPWLKNCTFAEAEEGAQSFHVYGCCSVSWTDIVTCADLSPDWGRFYIVGREGNSLEAVEFSCDCEPTYYTGGVPAPEDAPTVSATEECDRTADARVYVYTYVNKWGEESAPSLASSVIRVADGTSVTVSGFSDPPDDYGIESINLYRATTGWRSPDGKAQNFLTSFLFVANFDTDTDSYTDSTQAIYLGAALETMDDRMPPTLDGVVTVRDQIRLVGWRKNRIHMSEPLMPHNWPSVYDMTLDFNIVHMGELNQKLYVTTTSTPYIIDITQTDITKAPPVISVDTALPDIGCHRANGAVMTPHGLFYASPIGVILLASNGSWSVVTAKWFGEDEWRKLKPDTITMAYYEGYLFFSTEMGTFLLDVNRKVYENADNAHLVTLSDTPVACEVSNTGALLILQDDEILVWTGGDEPREYIWQSRPLTGGPSSVGRNNPDAQMSVSRMAETYSARGPLWAPGSVKLKGAAHVRLYNPHGVNAVDRFIGTERPVRARRVGRHSIYWLEVRSTQPVEFINIGTSYFTVNGGD